MNIAILFYAGENYGMGHYYRSLVMGEELRSRGHNVLLLSNLQMQRGWTYYQVRQDFLLDDMYHVFDQFGADWMIIDTPEHPNNDFFDYLKKYDVRTMLLNAFYNNVESNANISVVQGNLITNRKPAPNTIYLHGKDYVLLRPDLDNYKMNPSGSMWFVFGGSEDKLGLLKSFSNAMHGHNAILVHTDVSQIIDIKQSHKFILARVNNAEGFLELMQRSTKACTAMGMTAWELAYYGIPNYIFSYTNAHLEFAKGMEKLGIARVYPKVGVPDQAEMRNFLKQKHDFYNTENKPDLLGASRIADEMEGYDS